VVTLNISVLFEVMPGASQFDNFVRCNWRCY